MITLKKRDAFSKYHPVVNLAFFGFTIAFSMFFMHPVCLLISFAGALSYYIRLYPDFSFRTITHFILPVMLLPMIINPVFNHQGNIFLCYLPGGNPLTLESVFYGFASACMLISCVLWFACLSKVFTSDKFVYLFGCVLPALALLLSMTLRFIPQFKKHFDEVRDAQRGLNCDVYNGSVIKRFKNTTVCFSAVVTRALENSIDISDSMKARGYGTHKRSAFSVYVFTARDKTALSYILLCSLSLFTAGLSDSFKWRYFPSIRGTLYEPVTVFFQFIYLCFVFLPSILDIYEEKKWKSLESKI